MGDKLAEQLYVVFCAASNLVPGSGDVPNWASMPIEQREAWEHVATKARKDLSKQFALDMRTASDHYGPEQAMANLLQTSFPDVPKPQRRRIEIESDGTALNTRVLVDGKPIDCTRVRFDIEAESVAMATIDVYPDAIRVVGVADVEERSQ